MNTTDLMKILGSLLFAAVTVALLALGVYVTLLP